MSIRPLSKELQQKAILEMNEDPSRTQDDIDHILNWIHQQPHLHARTEPQWILTFLRGCKFSLQKTKEKLETYYSARSIIPYYFENRNPTAPEFRKFWKLNIILSLPKDSDCLAPLRYFFIFENSDPEKTTLKNGIKALLMMIDVDLYEDDAALINGQEIIIDFKNTPYAYAGQLTPDLLKFIPFFVEQLFPARIKGVHLIDVPKFLQVLLKTILSFLSEKLRSRVHFYAGDDYESLFKIIPRDVFPEEFGGSAGTLNTLVENCWSRVENYKKWFEEDAKYCTDESKRIGKSRFYGTWFEMEGSFRKLNVD